MTIQDWLQSATTKLKQVKIASARLDCLILLEDTLRRDRSWILANLDTELSENQTTSLNPLLERRIHHEPLAYIRGKSEFYGREFLVTPATLQPRPETETMMEMLIEYVRSKKIQNTFIQNNPPDEIPPTILDIGTGSGCLGITAKLEIPEAKVIATDINEDALQIARQNAKILKAEIDFYKGDLLKSVTSINQDSENYILANLPYVPDDYTINQAAMQEPKVAIFGGIDGLDLYRQMFDQTKRLPQKPDLILTESLPPQHQKLSQIAIAHKYRLVDTRDLIQVFTPEPPQA